MSLEERASATDRVLAARERYVARGVSTPSLVVDRAEGMRVWDADGREFLDFAGGIACQNLGHGPSSVVAAHREEYVERVDASRFRYDSELRFGTFETIT